MACDLPAGEVEVFGSAWHDEWKGKMDKFLSAPQEGTSMDLHRNEMSDFFSKPVAGSVGEGEAPSGDTGASKDFFVLGKMGFKQIAWKTNEIRCHLDFAVNLFLCTTPGRAMDHGSEGGQALRHARCFGATVGQAERPQQGSVEPKWWQQIKRS